MWGRVPSALPFFGGLMKYIPGTIEDFMTLHQCSVCEYYESTVFNYDAKVCRIGKNQIENLRDCPKEVE
jgi:hypothetical protein